MSTRGHICIKLKDEDLDKDFHMKDENGNDLEFTVHTKSGYPYMYVYNHHDSYVSGLGKSLANNLLTYEEVRDYILQGNRTTFTQPYTCEQYGESPEDNQPTMCADVSGEIPEEYFYLFEDGRWYVKSWQESVDGKAFQPLPMPKTIVLNEKEIEAIKWVIDKYEKIWNVIADINEDHHLVVMNQIHNFKKKFTKNESKGKEIQ